MWAEHDHLAIVLEEEFLVRLIPSQLPPRSGEGGFPLDLLTCRYRRVVGGPCDGESLIIFGVAPPTSYSDQIPFILLYIPCHRGGELDVTHIVIGGGVNVLARLLDPPYGSTMGELLGLVV